MSKEATEQTFVFAWKHSKNFGHYARRIHLAEPCSGFELRTDQERLAFFENLRLTDRPIPEEEIFVHPPRDNKKPSGNRQRKKRQEQEEYRYLRRNPLLEPCDLIVAAGSRGDGFEYHVKHRVVTNDGVREIGFRFNDTRFGQISNLGGPEPKYYNSAGSETDSDEWGAGRGRFAQRKRAEQKDQTDRKKLHEFYGPEWATRTIRQMDDLESQKVPSCRLWFNETHLDLVMLRSTASAGPIRIGDTLTREQWETFEKEYVDARK